MVLRALGKVCRSLMVSAFQESGLKTAQPRITPRVGQCNEKSSGLSQETGVPGISFKRPLLAAKGLKPLARLRRKQV